MSGPALGTRRPSGRTIGDLPQRGAERVRVGQARRGRVMRRVCGGSDRDDIANQNGGDRVNCDSYVFTTRTGRPLGQRNVARSLRKALRRATHEHRKPTFQSYSSATRTTVRFQSPNPDRQQVALLEQVGDAGAVARDPVAQAKQGHDVVPLAQAKAVRQPAAPGLDDRHGGGIARRPVDLLQPPLLPLEGGQLGQVVPLEHGVQLAVLTAVRLPAVVGLHHLREQRDGDRHFTRSSRSPMSLSGGLRMPIFQ